MQKSPNTKNTLEKSSKAILLGLFFLLIPLFSACESIPTITSTGGSHSQPYSILPQGKNTEISENFMQIKLLGSLEISSVKVNSLKITELSDLAWDKDEQLLYAVSDEGILYHLKITLSDGKLKKANIIFASRLKSSKGKKLKGKYSDSEGLSITNSSNGIKGDSQLIISFEGKPRVAIYDTKGNFVKTVNLPNKLRKKKSYRSKNKALESVTIHPIHGIITAAEYPLKKDPINYQSLYSAKGSVWHFPASKAKNSAVTGLEVLPNGNILVLERAYRNPLVPIQINLRSVDLGQCNKRHECKTQPVALFNGADGWLLDNVEGLTHLEGNNYLMVSDDNNNPLQKTILVLFEIKSK